MRDAVGVYVNLPEAWVWEGEEGSKIWELFEYNFFLEHC